MLIQRVRYLHLCIICRLRSDRPIPGRVLLCISVCLAWVKGRSFDRWCSDTEQLLADKRRAKEAKSQIEIKMCDSEIVRSPTKAMMSPTPTAADHLMEDLAKENYWLREQLKEMTSDRDRLLCEVANLRLELDMMELKRLPDDNK